MGEFMSEHPNLAKNIIPNCAQGKATALKLWANLTTKLNAAGPPVKDTKSWRKVYADQKYQSKKKLTFNKKSKTKTGGGPFEEKVITEAEENIIQASGLEATVEGMKSVHTWGNMPKEPTQELPASNGGTSECDPAEYLNEDNIFLKIFDQETPLTSTGKKQIENDVPANDNVPSSIMKRKVDDDIEEDNAPSTSKRSRKAVEGTKLALLEQNLKASNEAKLQMDNKLGRLLEIHERMLQIQERKLQIKEEEHKRYCKLNDMELRIRRRDLESFYDSD